MKIGFLSLPISGHLNPMIALARKLQSRGNEVVYFGVPDVEPVARAANLRFVSFGEEEFPVGSMARLWGEVANMHGLDVVKYSATKIIPRLLRPTLEELPGKLAETGVQALVLDVICRFVELVPMRLGMPYIQVYPILHYDFSGATPICYFSWPYEATPEARARNLEGLKLFGEIRVNTLALGKSYAEKVGMQVDWNNPAATVSKLAVISQAPKEFDFPIPELPPQFHYAGPFFDDAGREPVPFPWQMLTDEPLIYVSLGTLLNGLTEVYRSILRAMEKLRGIQVVISVGKNIDIRDLGPVPSNIIVVRSAPQIALLKRAALCITHGGLNTVLEALSQGVPMVAIPLGYDQPGVAARIAYHGAGEFVEVEDATAERLWELTQRVLTTPSYRDKARYFQKVIAETHGVDVAADIIERAFEESLTKEQRELVAK